MLVLALATSGPFPCVGLWRGSGPVETAPLGGADRGQSLMPAVDGLLSAHGLRPSDLGAIAVDLGPGSFTGIRVGVATAKALATALSVPLVGVTSLEALAVAAGPAPSVLLTLRDARAGEAYFALWQPRADGPDAPLDATPRPVRVARPARGAAADIRAAVEERGLARVLAVGEDAERLAVTLPLTGLLGGVRTPTAGPEAVLRVALPRLAAGTTDDPDALAPYYLQPSSPERRLAGEGPPA
jgi:tRNA threonylcarbamoyladenosine biosynthesis protein TsaB